MTTNRNQQHPNTYHTASQVGEYIYCHRAWWYSINGFQRNSQVQLQRGTQQHTALYRRIWLHERIQNFTRTLFFVLLFIAIILVTAKILGVL